ncbi:hypothetical protein V8F33_011832, partial [Rhypophila sp. PSN 637]
MSSSSVAYRQAATKEDWDRMRSTITDIWVNRAANRTHLVEILLHDYGFIATPKTCSTHLQRWGCRTYKSKSDGNSASPARRRKGKLPRAARSQHLATSNRVLHPLAPGTLNRQLPAAGAYRLPDFIIHSIDTFVKGVFADSVVRFGFANLVPQRDAIEKGSLQWQAIEILYDTAEINFRGGSLQRFARNMKTAHQNMWDLIRPPSGTDKERRRVEAKV